MYNDTVTIFCRYQSKLGDMWYPFVLHNVDVNTDKASIIAKYGTDASDNAQLHIKYQFRDGAKMIGDKKWLPPKEWDRQTNDQLSDTITFTGGENFDFFWIGEWTGDIPIADDDPQWSRKGFFAEMNSRYDYVFAITSVGGPYSVIPHFEILGK